MNKIRTERHQTHDHDPRELGEDVAGSNSKAFAEFLLGVRRESSHWNWANYCADVASELHPDDVEEIYLMLHTLTESILSRLDGGA